MRKNHILLIALVLFLSSKAFAQQDSLLILGLQECIQIALDNNLSVERSVLQKEGSRINYDQARASHLPSLNFSGSHGYNWGRSIDPTTNQFITEQIGFTSVGGSANMVLFNWFRVANSVKQNKILLESSDYDLQKTKNDITLNIVTFYLNVIFNKELVENAQFQLGSSKEQLDRTKKLVAGGALPRSSELELVSQVASNEVGLINAQNNLGLAKLNLKQAMMLPSSQQINLAIPELEISNGLDGIEPLDQVYERALDEMPEIRSAELRVKSAEVGMKVALSAYAPTLSLGAGFSTNYSDAFDQRYIEDNSLDPVQVETGLVTESGGAVYTFQQPGSFEDYAFGEQFRDNLSKRVSLSLSIPIFNNLQAHSNEQRQKIALRQAEIGVIEQRNSLRQSVESAYNDAEAASKVYQASLKQVEALEETFRSVENQFNLGAANFTDYQVASNNLYGAKSDLVRAKYDYIFKIKILDFYQGKQLTF